MKFTISFLLALFSINYVYGQITITSGRLSITIEQLSGGAKVSHIKEDGVETLNTSTSSEYFTLFIQDTTTANEYTISSLSGWDSVSITHNDSSCTLQFRNPLDTHLPSSLSAVVSINTHDDQSDWDLSVAGLGTNFSLMNAIFPKLNIKSTGSDTFLYPLYSGRLTPNPGSGIDYFDDPGDNGDNTVGLYPRGWGTTMPFMSYYNDNYGLYIGYHDPDASIKHFRVKNADSGIKIECKYPAPDKTRGSNDWDLPGVFELDVFDGNWYEAAQLYRTWASSNANYWPKNTSKRDTRQHQVGDIGVWLTTYISEASTMAEEENNIQTAIDFFDVPVGVHAYEWNYKEFDHFYPDYFPERTGFSTLVSNIQTNNNAVIMPYTNGRLWDTGEGGSDPGDAEAATFYNNDGYPDAAKKEDSLEYTQTFSSNVFAVMCPKQTDWSDRMVNIEDTITNPSQIGAKALYLDMVAASSPVECMDTTHIHPLGGGDYWRKGYQTMLGDIHNKVPDSVFLTVEGGCDYIADEVDAFMVQGWTTDHQVPAWQAVYSGKVQLFGTKTGGSQYGNQQFYAKLAQGYIFGVQTGRQYIWLAINPDANPNKSMASHFVKRLSRMRYKLRDFLSYGTMKKPLSLSGKIPDLTYHVWDWGGHQGYVDVNYPAVQNSVWQHGDSVVVSLINASLPDEPNVIDDSLTVSFSFDGSRYGMDGALAVNEITENGNGSVFFTENNFTLEVNIPSITPKAYLIRPASDLGTVYYVSTTGDDANDGLSESQAWRTISYAASASSPVNAGDVVYVKAGNYGAEHVAFQTNGSDTLPILFMGYTTTPGDNPDLHHAFGDPLDSTVMPLLDANNRDSGDVAITFYHRKHIILKNFQVTQYEVGIDGYDASNITLDNITATLFGNVDSSYSGKGISLTPDGGGNGGNKNILRNCFVENAAAEGFNVVGDSNLLHHCTVYCDQNTGSAAMDYYIHIAGDYNTVDSCHAERVGLLDHDGHGIGLKGDCQHNLVKNSTAKNLSGGFYVRHRGCKYNTFDHCKSYDLGGFLIRDGASHNTFKNCEGIHNESAVRFSDTDEDGGAQYTGRHNVFENCIFRNTTESAIDFFYYSLESVCDSNTFKNCVFDSADYLFNCDRSNQDNKMVNCIVTNINNYYRTAYHQATSYPLNITIEYTNFYDNGFAAPSGSHITTFDPKYVDIAQHDYHLQSVSPCIDAGITTESPAFDKEEVFRPLMQASDLGAYEFGIYWTGCKGNRWNNPGNWSNNQVPAVTDKVTIPSPEYYYNRPEVYLNAQVKTLFLNDKAQMLIKNSAVFQIIE